MPLILSVKEKDRLFIDEDQVTVGAIYGDGQVDLEVNSRLVTIGDERATEIIPEVMVSAGLLANNPTKIRLIFKAPAHVKIRRAEYVGQYTALDAAIQRGKDFGLTEADVCKMAYRGAVFTHPFGNTRFDDFWFRVLDGKVEMMGKINQADAGERVLFPDAALCQHCHGTMKVIMVNPDKTEQLVPCARMQNRSLILCDQV